MKRNVLFILTLLMAGRAVAVLYTNIPDGATLTVPSDVTVVNSALEYTENGVLIGDGSHAGVLTGPGNLSFSNQASNNWPGVLILNGIAGNVTLSNYTGSLRVENDLSVYTAAGAGWKEAQSESYGINGPTTGDLNGNLTVIARGGTAIATSTNWAFAHATARGLNGSVTGDINSQITVIAIAGTGIADQGAAGAYTDVAGINGDVTGTVNGNISVIGHSGTATTTTNASYAGSTARGINGNVNGNVFADITVHATAGMTSGPIPVNESVAAGIEGPTIQIAQFSGHINVTATAGINSNETILATPTKAYGIKATDTLLLNATNGSIHAQIQAYGTMGLSSLPGCSVAYAILGGTGNDTVWFSDMDLIGDIDLGNGNNLLTVFGDTRMQGDIAATGGDLDFKIISGMFTPVGHVHVSDLRDNEMAFTGTGGLDVELYEDPNNELNSKLIVDGNLIATTNTSIAARAAAGQTAANLIGNSYEVATASDISGTFVENEQSMLRIDIAQNGTNIVITPTRLRDQDGEHTSGGGGVTKATINAANAVMNDISERSCILRLALRGIGNSPRGASGPNSTNAFMNGEWLIEVRQINDIGSQDSEGGIAGFDWNSHGFTVGAERLADDGVILGAASGGSWTDIDGDDGAGGGASEMFITTLYANLFSDTWYTDAGINYGHAWNDAERIATDLQRYIGEYESDLYGGWLETGYTIGEQELNAEPYVRTTYISGNHNSYTDEGGTDPLSVSANGTDNWMVEAGLRGRREWTLENEDIIGLELKAGVQQELLDDTVSANGSLLGVDQELSGPDAERTALVLGAKADWQISESFSLKAEYAPTIAENWINHSLNAAIEFTF